MPEASKPKATLYISCQYMEYEAPSSFYKRWENNSLESESNFIKDIKAVQKSSNFCLQFRIDYEKVPRSQGLLATSVKAQLKVLSGGTGPDRV